MIKPARKSAAIILCSQHSSPSQCRILMLRRLVGMSFGNQFAYPGGVCDQSDTLLACSHDFQIYAKVTAIRQLLEETGILIYPNRIDINAHLGQTPALGEIGGHIGQIWENSLSLIKNMMRLVTPQFPKLKRYDCMFLLVRIGNKISAIDVNTYWKPNSPINAEWVNNLQNIVINQSQSSSFVFENARNLLKMSKNEKKKLMAPPQLLTLSCMARLTSFQPIDSSSFTCLPIMFQLQSSPNSHWLLPGDSEYRIEEAIQNQPDYEGQKTMKEAKAAFKSYPQKIRRIVQSPLQLQTSFMESSMLVFITQQKICGQNSKL